MRRTLIALTGGPCSGKTTLAERLGERGAIVVPEAALEVIQALNEELGGPDAQRAWHRAHVLEFQRRVSARQRSRERAAASEGALPDGRLVVFDRTSVDGVAYLRYAGYDVPADLDAAARAVRADLVFELELLADVFDARLASGRSGTLAEAREISAVLHDTYVDFGHAPILLPASLSLAERAEEVLRAVERWRARQPAASPTIQET